MVELFITVLARIHRFLSHRVYYRMLEKGNVRYHSLDGKWMGGAQLSTGKVSQETGELVPYPDGPRWEAFIFGSGISDEDRRRVEFVGLEDTEAATRQLLWQHHGPYLVTERKFGT